MFFPRYEWITHEILTIQVSLYSIRLIFHFGLSRTAVRVTSRERDGNSIHPVVILEGGELERMCRPFSHDEPVLELTQKHIQHVRSVPSTMVVSTLSIDSK